VSTTIGVCDEEVSSSPRVLAGVGAAAAIALFAAAPVASADETPALSVDDIAVPAAAVAPSGDEITNVFTIGEGGTEVTYTHHHL
jgi:hypothetical protein